LALFKDFGGNDWEFKLRTFLASHLSLIDLYTSKKTMTKMPVLINKEAKVFTTGKHNKLQKLILEEFAPRFAPYSKCLYVGDTAEKDLHKDTAKLQSLGSDLHWLLPQ